MRPSRPPSDLDLLALRARLASGSQRSIDHAAHGLRLAASVEGWSADPFGDLPDHLAAEVGHGLDGDEPDITEAHPSALWDCVDLLERSLGPVRVEGEVVFAIEGRVGAPAVDAAIVTSADTDVRRLLAVQPLSWEGAEWRRLVEGDLGPWAVAVDGDRVVSLCHTPVPLTNGAGECGVWTHPEARGRGLAPATTAAWTRLVSRPGRRLFYATDAANAASQRVASQLGLRLIGRRWTINAGPWPEGDAWGDALLDHHRGRWVPPLELEVEGGPVGEGLQPEWFFRHHDRWDRWEQELVALARQGPALDLGAGAGRTSLWLQGHGIEVTAVDSSPGAVQVCRERGVIDVRLGDLRTPPGDRSWRAVFLLCGNLGLGGTWDTNRALLARLAAASAPDAVLVGDTVEPEGRAEIRLRIRSKGAATPWWRQRNIAVDEVPALVEGTGWRLDRHLVDLPDHAVLLRRT